MLCAEDEQGRICWMTAFRLLKVGASVPVRRGPRPCSVPVLIIGGHHPSCTRGFGGFSQRLPRGRAEPVTDLGTSHGVGVGPCRWDSRHWWSPHSVP